MVAMRSSMSAGFCAAAGALKTALAMRNDKNRASPVMPERVMRMPLSGCGERDYTRRRRRRHRGVLRRVLLRHLWPDGVLSAFTHCWLNPSYEVARCSLPPRDSHVSGIDGELEAGQEAHAKQAIDALAKGAFGIIMNDDGDIFCLQRAQLDRLGTTPFCRAGSVGRIQSDDAAGVDLHLGLLRKCAFQGHEGRAGIEDEEAPCSVDQNWQLDDGVRPRHSKNLLARRDAELAL